MGSPFSTGCHTGRVRLTLLCAALYLSACSPDTATAPREAADLLVRNGKVLTMDARNSEATAFVVRDQRIIAVGGNTLESTYDAAQTVDLGGRTVIPGFIDSHTHISGHPPRYIDLTRIGSIEAMLARVADKARALGPGEWITGYGWSEDELTEGRRPLRADLDAVAPDNPVVLTRAGGHSAVGNSLALQLAGIDATTPDPHGGIIERDDAGVLNGIIRERHDLLTNLVPEAAPADLRASLVGNLQALFAHGITSIVQAQDTIDYYPEWQHIYSEHRGDLPRAAVQLAYEGREQMQAFGRKTGDGDEHLRVGAIKIFVDGGFTGPAAYTSRPYKGEDEYRGKLNLAEAELQDLIRTAHEDGWQLGIHAIGDAAIDLTVSYLVSALSDFPRANHRHYLNHFTVMPRADTMQQMARFDIAITQQPNFTYTLEGRYVANLDGDRLETNNPLRTPMDHGIHLAISSDILPIGPMRGISAAVNRQGMSGRVFGAQEALSPMEALRGYTIQGAYLTFEEHIKGSIEPDKLADFVVLSRNPLTTPGEEIADIQVLETYLGGRRVYRAESQAAP